MIQVKAILALSCLVGCQAAKLTERFAWNQLDFSWPDDAAKDVAIQSGAYIPENNLPLGLARWENKLFITVPRWKSGVASTLNYINVNGKRSQPLKPYPSWSFNFLSPDVRELKDNSTILSVFRISVDVCDRLWVMDTGFVDILGKAIVMSQPSLIIFDLKTDKLIHRYFFRQEDVEKDSHFANVVVDVNPAQCDDAYAYASDFGGCGVVVYSLRMDRSWRVKHSYFQFDPLSVDYNIGGLKLQWNEGVISLALGVSGSNGYRPVYFHAMSSTKEYVVSSEVLKNETWATSKHNFDDFSLLGDKGPKSQTLSSSFDDKTGVLFYAEVNRDGVACWNSKNKFNSTNHDLVYSDAKTMVFPSDLKIDSESNLWVLSNRMPKFTRQTMDTNEVNYRIFFAPASTAVEGTKCA